MNRQYACHAGKYSVAMPFNVDHAAGLIAALKGRPAAKDIRVMLGGRIIAEMPGLAAEAVPTGGRRTPPP